MVVKMKKWFIWILAVIMFALLPACNKPVPAPRTETAEINGQTLTITFDEHNLSAGKIATDSGEYTFAYTASGQDTTLTIVYPDGYVYSQTQHNGGISFPAAYDAAEREAKGYMDGFSLAWAIENAMGGKAPAGNNGASPLLAIILLALGAWNTFAPKTAWWLARGWWYKNAEPSELALVLYRGLGVLLIVIGLICLVAA